LLKPQNFINQAQYNSRKSLLLIKFVAKSAGDKNLKVLKFKDKVI